MDSPDRDSVGAMFSLAGQVAVVTGGSGVLGVAMATGLARAGARVTVIGRRPDRLEQAAAQVAARAGLGADAVLPVPADVTKHMDVVRARDLIVERLGGVRILVNAAGGNVPGATLAETSDPWSLPPEALREVVDLNLLGTMNACAAFAEAMASTTQPLPGCIVNISSMAADRALTRVGGYGAAKAGVESYTRWLAVELGRRTGGRLRVNAIAPGFLVGDQNRSLLLDPAGELTARGRRIIEHTPAGRFGEPDELVGTLVWLCGPGAAFVTGAVIPVDGGFGAFSGV